MKIDRAYSSPLRRALRTSRLAGFEHPDVTDLLREVDYGSYEGLTSEQIHESNPGWELYRDGCPGGETPSQVYARALRFIDLVNQGLGGGGDRTAIAFAHGHILRAVAVAWIGAGITVAAGLQLDVASLNMLRDADRGRVIALWNAT